MSKEASSPVADSSTAHDTIKDKKDSVRMPGGSIELLYCEKCGGLILGGEKNALPAPNGSGYYCKKCSATAAKPGTDTAPLLAAAPASGDTKEIPKRRPSSVVMPSVKRESGPNSARSKVLEPQGRSKRQTPSGKPEGEDSNKIMIGGAAACVVLLLLAFALFGGSSKSDPSRTASASKTEPERSTYKEPERRATPQASETPAQKVILPASARSEPPVQPIHKQPEAPAPQEMPKAPEAAPQKDAPATDKPAESENKLAAPADKADPAKKEDKDQAAALQDTKKQASDEEDVSKQPAKAATGAEKNPANPFSVAEGGDPTKVLPGQKPAQPAAPAAPTPAKPKPIFEKGKQCLLFPVDRDSKTVDHQSPAMAQGQKTGIQETKFDGWSFMGRKLDAWSVKGGVLNIDGQCALTLDGFPSKDFDLKMEVDLGNMSALGVMLGAAKEGISLMAVVPTHVLPGVWDQTKTQNNVQMDNKAAKPHGVKEQWIPIHITVMQGMVEVFANNKSVYKEKISNPTQFPQFGFLMLGLNNNANPTAKVRNVSMFAP